MATFFLPPTLWRRVLELGADSLEDISPLVHLSFLRIDFLLSTSLVSRTFANVARPLLFRQVKVRTTAQLGTAACAVEGSVALSQAVETVKVEPKEGGKGEDAEKWREVLDRLLRACTSLRSVELVFPLKADSPEFSLVWAGARADTLEELSLSNVIVTPVLATSANLRFPRLSLLKLADCRAPHGLSSLPVAVHCPQLGALEVTSLRRGESAALSPLLLAHPVNAPFFSTISKLTADATVYRTLVVEPKKRLSRNLTHLVLFRVALRDWHLRQFSKVFTEHALSYTGIKKITWHNDMFQWGGGGGIIEI
ncbi:hypothetical protein JCM10213_003619 [Rhodosporidiobolus nylandii]